MLAIKKSDFYFRVKSNEETWNVITEGTRIKETQCTETISKAFNLVRENDETSKQLCKADDEGELRIDEMDIFKTSFWNEPIPKRKFDALITKNMIARLKSKQRINLPKQGE